MVSARSLSLCTLVGSVVGDFTAPLDIKTCSKDGCKSSTKRVSLDTDAAKTQHLVSTSGDALTLKYESGVGGPRVYLIEEDGTNKNTMFDLQGKEFSFDVELSTMNCGFNAALYFVGMTENEGEAEAGSKYCDAQAVGGTYCSEMDIFEGNTEAQAYTTHGCNDACASFTEGVADCAKGAQGEDVVCDHNGCGMNPFRYGPGTTYDQENSNWNWYGSGSGYTLDSSKPFTVTTQFETRDRISRFYMQDGNRIDLPTLYLIPPSSGTTLDGFDSPVLNPDFCGYTYDKWDGGANHTALGKMWDNMEQGMVLAMSAWYDKETYVDGKLPDGVDQTGMSWMDGTNAWAKSGPCNATTSDDGAHEATFSNIRFGDIGTTTKSEITLV